MADTFSAFLLPVFGAIRLARFNTNSSDENFFRGLPIPANGIFWAAMGLMLQSPKYADLLPLVYTTKNLVILGVFMAGMMVIHMPMFSMKPKSLRWSENWYLYIFLGLSALIIIFLNIYGLALIIFLYILLNAIFYVAKVKF